MGFFRKFAGFLGFGSHNEAHETRDEDDDHNNNNNFSNSDDIRRNRMNVDPIPAGPRKGFGVPVQIPVSVGPNLVPCNGDGGVQGLRWYAAHLRIDEDGDVADEFLFEVSQETSSVPQDQANPTPKFQAKRNARRAKIKQQVFTPDGKLQHCVDYQGQLQWV
ncbi:hypothetical protein RND81_06G219200 [Saponaria officinalis]|uniref:Uncharacterized protein n=1 Tax=Saponaria officinalis TaxID=3572 RepID=A0AAW1KEA1_SAPOF